MKVFPLRKNHIWNPLSACACVCNQSSKSRLQHKCKSSV